jgi:hypothetical protein
MFAISSKLALLVFVLPLSFLVISDVVVFLAFGVVYIEVIAIFTSNWVFLLVWERLRESLSKKLLYLHENFIFDIYNGLKTYEDNINAYFVVDTEHIKKNRVDLEKYARFLMISLFPKELFSKIDQFISNNELFMSHTQTVTELGKKKIRANFSQFTFLHFLGFNLRGIQIDSNTASVHQDVAEKVKTDHSTLLNDMNKLLKNLVDGHKEILLELEDFLKANNLKLKQESTFMRYYY